MHEKGHYDLPASRNPLRFPFSVSVVGGAFRERFVGTHKKMYGPNPKTFPVGPVHRDFSLRQAVLYLTPGGKVTQIRDYSGQIWPKIIQPNCYLSAGC